MAGFEALAQLGIEFTSKTAAKAEKDILGVERAADRAEQSMEELSARSKKLATDLANAGKSGRKATDDLNNLRLATNRVEASTQSVTARFDKMFASVGGGQMAMRQTAFQLNQIAQQGAVTGNYMGALAVQSADILTVFGMWGILAGGAIAVMGPFITSLFSSGDAVKELDGLLQGASETLGEYRQSAELAAMSTEELERRFGSAGASMKTLMTVLDDLKARAAQRSIDEVSASISELLAVAGDGEKRGAIADFFDVNIFLAFTDKARDARDTARELTGEFLSAQKALDYAATIEKSTDRLNAQIDGTQRLLDVSIQLADADGLRTKAEDDLITKIAESLKQMRMLQGTTEDASLIDKKRRATAQEMIDQYARQAEMANTIAAYGKDSAEAELLKRAEAIRTAEAMIEQKGLSGDVAEQVLKAAMAAYDAEANSAKAAVALRDAETAAKGLASAIASAAGFSLSLENGVRVLEAQVTALKNGADAAIASTIETMKIKAEQMKQDQIKAGVDKVIAEAQYALDMVAIADQEKLLGQKNALTEATKKAASAGSKHARQLERELEAVRKSLSPLSAYNEELAKLTKLRGYANLKKQIDLAITAVEDADIPDYLKTLLSGATDGVTSYVDFVLRSDLDADLRWLALTGASEHITTVQYLAQNKLGANLTKLAVSTVSTLQKTVNLLAGAGLDRDTMRLALAGNSELSRVVNATLAADIDKQAKRLALGNLGAYSVSVMASLSPAVSTRVRQIVFGEQGTYAAVIEAAISSDMTAAARRILLTRQGDYIANITGVLVSSMTNSVRELLLEANTAAVRSVTIRKVWADSLTRDEKSLLRDAETTAMRTIRAAVQMAGVSVDGMLFLTQISAGKTDFQKSLIGKIALGTLGADEKRLLRAADSYVTTLIKGSYDLSSIRASTRATKLLDAVDQVFGSKLVASFDLGAVSNARRQRLLDATGLSFVSKLVAGFDLAGIDSARKRALLDADDLTLTSTLTGKYDIAKLLSSDRAKVLLDANSLNFTSTLFGKSDLRAVSADALALLGAKTSSITKTLLGVDKSGGISGNGWTLLKAVTSSITKTIQGKVDLSGLTDRQKSLLDAITGATVGKVTLGGSFVFDPSTSFETLLGGSIEAPMDAARLAMGTLTGALDDLRSAIAAETARAEYESKVAALQMQGSAAASALASTKALQSSTADDLTALFASLGVSTVGGSVKVKNGQLTETYDHLVTSGSWEPLMKALRSNYGVKGGTVAELMSAIFDQVNSPLAGQQTTLKDLRAAYRKLTGEAPSFATGGDHRGGFAHIGENDLELVAPSRIYNPGETKAMLDNREVIAELKALRAEVKQLRDEQRQLDISRNNDLRKLRTIEERREAEA